MKNYRTFALSILLFLVVLVGCSDKVVDKLGTLQININTSVSRGIQAISMETAYYNVVVKNSSDEIVASIFRDTRTSYSASLPAGTYSISVEALNSTGDVIGTGSCEATVVGGQTNSFNITVSEAEGNGAFSMAIAADSGYTLSYVIKTADGTTVRSGNLEYSEGVYSASETLANGFYTFTITRTDTSKVLKYDTVRIITDKDAMYSATFVFGVDESLTILNEITKTPKIVIALDKSSYMVSDTLNASATIEDITGTSFYWAIDGIKQDTTDTCADLSLSLASFSDGEHEISLFVSDGSIIWSESAKFSVGQGYRIVGIPLGIDFGAENVYVSLYGESDADYFDLMETTKTGYDHAYLIRYPAGLHTWYQHEYGGVNPSSGNPFWTYLREYYDISVGSLEEMAKIFLVNHMAKDSFLIIPTNSANARNWRDPYLSADYSSINENGEIVGFMFDNGYQPYIYRDISGDRFTQTDRIFMNIVTDGTEYRYCIILPSEVAGAYADTDPDQLTTSAAVTWYMNQYYGIENPYDCSISELKSALVTNGYIKPTVEDSVIRIIEMNSSSTLSDTVLAEVGSDPYAWRIVDSNDTSTVIGRSNSGPVSRFVQDDTYWRVGCYHIEEGTEYTADFDTYENVEFVSNSFIADKDSINVLALRACDKGSSSEVNFDDLDEYLQNNPIAVIRVHVFVSEELKSAASDYQIQVYDTRSRACTSNWNVHSGTMVLGVPTGEKVSLDVRFRQNNEIVEPSFAYKVSCITGSKGTLFDLASDSITDVVLYCYIPD